MLSGPLLGMPLPLRPLQILWMNLVTDGLPALALGLEPAEEDVMLRPPKAATESIFGRGMGPFIVVLGLIASLVSTGVGLLAFRHGDVHWQTLLFTTLIFSQLALALGVRSETRPLWKLGVLSNPSLVGALLLTVALQLAVVYLPFLQTILGTTSLPVLDLMVAFPGRSVRASSRRGVEMEAPARGGGLEADTDPNSVFAQCLQATLGAHQVLAQRVAHLALDLPQEPAPEPARAIDACPDRADQVETPRRA